MKNLLKKISKHASHVVKHIHRHKRHYLLGSFGSFAVVKMIIVFAGIFGLINLASTFASGGPTASDVTVSGSPYIGELLTGAYTFTNTNDGWTSLGNRGFSAGYAPYTSLAIDNNGIQYLAFADGYAGDSIYNGKATVRKYTGTGRDVIGTRGFSAGEISYTSLVIDNDGTPYVAYKDAGNENRATVMKYNSGTDAWETVGTGGFSTLDAYYTSLAIDSNGTPYIAYEDYGMTGKATVMKYNSGTDVWETLGTTGFSADQATYTSLAIDNNNTPYIAYKDYGNLYKSTVMKFSGTDWTVLGTAGFSDGEIAYTSLAIDNDGTPYIGYKDGFNGDGINNGRASVMKYNSGTDAWEAVGNTGFAAGEAYDTSLAIDNNGTPYVAYQDYGNLYKSSLMKYNSGTDSWENIGMAGFSVGQAAFVSLSIYNGTPYVGYTDDGRSATVMQYISPDPESGSVYQWYRDDVAITGAEQTGYTTTLGDLGGLITFKVTPVSASGLTGTTIVSSNAITIIPPTVSDITIAGNPYIGELLTGSYTYTYSDLDPEGASVYQWYRDDVAITGAEQTGYTVTSNDLGTAITFKVTPISLSGIVGATGTSNGITIVPPVVSAITIDGNPYIGELLTGSYTYTYSDLDPESGSIYQWYRDDVAITGAEQTGYTVTSNDLNTTITFKVTPISLSGIVGATGTSNGITIVPPVVSAITISGEPYIGELLTGSYTYTYSDLDPEGASIYQWNRDGETITGATGLTYTTVSLDAGATITFQVTPISQSLITGDIGSSAGLDINVGPVATSVSIAGTLDFGETLTASYVYSYGGWANVGTAGFVENVAYTSLAIDTGGVQYIAFNDAGHGARASVAKFNGTTREVVGTRGFSAGEATNISLAIDNSGTPYIAYSDRNQSNSVTVMKYNSGNGHWENVGNAGFTATDVLFLSLAINSSGVPYVAYYDKGASGRASVMGYNTGNGHRENVGNAGFSANEATYISFDIDTNDVPYIAYADKARSNAVTVMKYNSGNGHWEWGGDQPATAGDAKFVSLAIDGNNDTYFAYADKDKSYNVSVMKYNTGNGKWENVGMAGFGAGETAYESLAIDSNNDLYVGYEDIANANKATVMKYNTGNGKWENIGSAGFSSADVAYTTLAIGSGNRPYLGFSDKAAHFGATVMTFSEDPEGTSTYKWYRNNIEITGATTTGYTLITGDAGKTFIFEVTPISQLSVPGATVQSNELTMATDADSDGILTGEDNCSLVYNPGQADADLNGIGDACDCADLTCTQGNDVNGDPICDPVDPVCPVPPSGGGGGGGAVLLHDVCPEQRDCSSSYYDNLCGPCPTTGSVSTTGAVHGSASCDVSNSPYTTEFTQAFSYAYDNGITTKCPISTANLTGKITREQFAKMISEFAIKELNKQPDTKLSCRFADTNNQSPEMQFYITTACQFRLMGRESAGNVTKKTFDPTHELTRAELATVISRLLYGDTYNNTRDVGNWASLHLQALNKAKIINDISTPTMQEIRVYVMIMLQRIGALQ